MTHEPDGHGGYFILETPELLYTQEIMLLGRLETAPEGQRAEYERNIKSLRERIGHIKGHSAELQRSILQNMLLGVPHSRCDGCVYGINEFCERDLEDDFEGDGLLCAQYELDPAEAALDARITRIAREKLKELGGIPWRLPLAQDMTENYDDNGLQ